MAKRLLTPELVRASSYDAGNRSMRAHNRTAWSREDYDAACQEFARLQAILDDQTPPE